jgi:hypothetical protein
MLLRRITQHVKDQNWFAVVIDFAIVVFGILLAFQVTEWNQRLKNNGIEGEYLMRIARDLERDSEALQGFEALKERQVARLLLVIYLNSDPEEAITRRCDYLGSLVTGVTSTSPDVFDQTINEMVGSGGVVILQDDALKDLISQYYNSFEAYESSELSARESFNMLNELSWRYLPVVMGIPMLDVVHQVLGQNGNLNDHLNSGNTSFDLPLCNDYKSELDTFYETINIDPAFSGYLQIAYAEHHKQIRFVRRQQALNQNLKTLIEAKLNP